MGTLIGLLLATSLIVSFILISGVTSQDAIISYIAKNGDSWDLDEVRKLYGRVAMAGISITLLGHAIVAVGTYSVSYWLALLVAFVYGLTILCMSNGFSSAERKLNCRLDNGD